MSDNTDGKLAESLALFRQLLEEAGAQSAGQPAPANPTLSPEFETFRRAAAERLGLDPDTGEVVNPDASIKH